MASEWFERVQRVFHDARGLSAEDRSAFLGKACADDDALREEVESLLRVDSASASDFMNEPALGRGLPLSAPSSGDDTSDTDIPEAIGQYRIIRRLGVGGMGIVYEAEQQKTGSTIALKVIRPGFASHGNLRRFEHEALVLGRLRHPGIARVYEAGIHSEGGVPVPFIAMELIEGPSLLEYVKRASPDVRRVLRLFAMICDAVQHAHQKGVIHRDLKPGNILVEREGDTVQPKILDFGIARVTDADTLVTTQQTQTGQLIGTVKYMSPEQAAGDPTAIDTRSDVYALGVILYELLARQMPYDVDRRLLHESVRAIREDEARPLSSVSRTYRGDLTTILGKALEKEKSRRYQSASELAADIRRHLNNEPIAAHPPSAMYQLRKFAHRNRGLVASVAVVFLLLVLGIIATSWQATVAARARLAEQRQRERAERRFQEVRDLANALVFEFDERVKWLAGATPVRELLVKQGLEYLNSIAEDVDPDDLSMLQELGEAYFRLGNVQGDPAAPNLGDPEGALESYITGLRFLEAIADADPGAMGPRMATGLACNRIALLLRSMDRQEEADAYHDRALRSFEQLHREFPKDAGILRELGHCYGMLATAHERAGRMNEAAEVGRKALGFFRAAVEREPNIALSQHAVASMCDQLAGVLEDQSKHAEALSYRRECLSILESLAAGEPHNATFRRDVGIAADNVGRLYLRAGHPEEAVSSFQRAVELAEHLLAADPNYERVQDDLLRAYTHLGEAQLGLGHTVEANKTFRMHLELCEAHAEQNGGDAGARRQLGVAYYKMAEVETAQARNAALPHQQRREHWREAVAWLHKCHTVFKNMQDHALLAPADREVPAEIAAEIAACESERAALGPTP
jgi:tetratricopeptide (TPR) repeat protein